MMNTAFMHGSFNFLKSLSPIQQGPASRIGTRAHRMFGLLRSFQSLDGEAAVLIPGKGKGGIPTTEYHSPFTSEQMNFCGSFDGQTFVKIAGATPKDGIADCHTPMNFDKGEYYDVRPLDPPLPRCLHSSPRAACLECLHAHSACLVHVAHVSDCLLCTDHVSETALTDHDLSLVTFRHRFKGAELSYKPRKRQAQ